MARVDRRTRRPVRPGARAERSFAALELTLYEIANVVVRKWRSRSLALQLVDGVAAVCGERLIRLDDALLTAAIETAERGRLTVYGAAYVACAQLRGWTLYSTDRRDLVDPGHALMP